MSAVTQRVRILLVAAALPLVLALSGCGVTIPLGGALAGLFLTKKSSSGGVVVVRSKDTNVVLSRGAFDVGDSSEGRGRSVVATQLELTATNDATLRSIAFSITGTGSVSAVPVRLYIDADKDGSVGANDTQLDRKTASGGAVSFSDLGLALAGGKALDLLVVIDTPADAKDGDTFQVSVTSAESLDATVATSTGSLEHANVLGVPYSGGVKTISPTGSLRAFVGPNTPKDGAVFTNARGASAVQVELRASSVEALRLTELDVKTDGTGDDSTALRASLYVDADSDGKLSAGDTALATGVAVPADDGTIAFTGLAQTIAAGEIVRLLVVFDFTGTALDGQTFRAHVTSVATTGETSGKPVVATGTPIDGATLTVTRATLSLAAGAVNPARTAAPSATNVPVLQLTVSAGAAEPVVVSSLAIHAAGSGIDSVELAAVRLALDADGDGVFSAGDVVLAGPLTYSADDGTVVFSSFQRMLGAGATERWLVLYDVASVASGGHTFTAAVAGPSDVTATGQTSGLAVATSVTGAQGGTLTIVGSLAVAAGPSPPPAQTPFANGTDVPVLQLRLAAGAAEPMRVTSIRVNPAGSGDDKACVATVELWLDADASGTVSAGDTLLASGSFPADDSPVALSNANGLIPGDIAAGATADLLVRYVLSGKAVQGDGFTATVGPQDITAKGVASSLAAATAGATVTSNPIVAQRGSLSLVAGPQDPVASTVIVGSTNVSVLQVKVTAGAAEAVSLSSLTLRASGTANDATAIQSVQLYVEGAGTPGQLDASDTQLGTTQSYASDDGSVTFAIAPPLSLPAASSATLLAIVQVAPGATAGGTFTTRLGAAGDVTATGATSALTATVLGAPVAGGAKTLALPPASQIVLTSGDAQSGTAGSALASPCVVTVKDSGGGAVPGVLVTFAVTSGGGSLATTSMLTNASGQALTTLTLGTVAGTNQVTASAPGLAGSPVTFTATGVAGAATQIATTSGDGQTGTAGSALAAPFVVTVRDANGNPVSGFSVAFAPTLGGGNVSVTNATTNASGQASTTLTLGGTAGLNRATATATGLAGSPVTFNATGVAGTATQIALTSGDAQTGTAGSALAAPFVVTVRDVNNNPVAGVLVSWSATSGGGSMSASSVPTNASGQAASTLTLGTSAGTNQAQASVAGLAGSPVTFTATGNAGAAAQIVLASGSGQTGVAGAALAAPFVVTVKDANANPVAGTTVSFATASGGSLSAVSATTNGAGQAATTLTLAAIAGVNTTTASATGLAGSPVTFTATGIAGAANQIALVSGDGQSGTVNTLLAAPFQVVVKDANGNPVQGTIVTWTVTGGAGGLSTASGPTDAAGLAASSLRLGTVAGVNSATASVTGLAGSPVAFTATGLAGAATQIVKTAGDSQSGVAGAALAAPFVVTVKDANANPVAGTTVTFATSTGGSLSAVSVLTDVAGQASSTLTLAPTAGSNTATASATGLAGSPVSFSATGVAGAATQIASSSGDAQSGTVGTPLAAPFVVVVKDANGNPVSGVLVSWAVTAGGGGVSPTSALTDGAGHASATLTLGTTAGPNAASATVAGLAGSPVGFTATGVPGTATQIVLASGNGQTAPSGATLPSPFVVTVKDANGNGVAGTTVTWAVTGGGGGLSSLITTTNASGQAASTLTLGSVGANSATASAAGLAGSPVSFSATATAGSTVTVAASQGGALSSGPIVPGDSNKPVLQVHLAETSGTGGFDLKALNVQATGTGDDANDIVTARLWIDRAPLGVVDASDTLIGISKYFADDGVLAFAGLIVSTVPANGSLDLLVTYDMGDAAHVTVGKTYAARIATSTDVVVQSNPGAIGIIPSGTFPLAGPTFTATTTTLTVATGPANPTGTLNVRDGQGLIAMTQLSLTAGASGPVTVTGLNVSATGTANDATGIAAVSLYEDGDGDGAVSAGDLLIVRATSPFAVDNGKAALSGFSQTIPAGTTVKWLVVYTLANTALANQTFQAFVASASDVIVASPATVNGTFPVAPPGSRRTLNVQGGVTLSFAPGNPVGTTLAAPSNDNVVLELAVTADAAEAMNLSGLTVTATGTTNPGSGGSFTAVKLWLDRTGDDALQTSGGSSDAPVLQSLSNFSASNTAAFSFTAISIPAGGSAHLFLSVSVKGGPTPNGTFVASVAKNSDVTVTGATTGSTMVAGAAVVGQQFQTGATTGLFLTATPVSLFVTGQTVLHVAVADFDRNGTDDFVALRSGGKIEVHLGDGTGAFAAGPGGSPAGAWPVGSPPAAPSRFAVGDWNGDGYPDVVVAYQGEIVLYLNDGKTNPGAFSTSVTTGAVTGASFVDVKLCDYDGDGKLDLVATDAGNNRLYGRRNNGSGGFAASANTMATTGVPRRLAIADVNGDGHPDVIYTEGGTKVILATGDGTFFAIASTATVSGANMVDVTVLDVDRDGYPDAVVVDESANPNNKWRVFKSTSPGQTGLTAAANGSTSPGSITQLQPHDIASGDWNGDGIEDTAIVHANPPGIVAYVSNGSGNFPPGNTTAYGLSAGTAPDRIAVGDFNRDHSPDLIAASSTVNDVAFLFAAGGGFTGGGTGDFLSPSQNPWGLTPTPKSVTIADFDHDGALDFVVSAREDAFALWKNNGRGSFVKQADMFVSGVPGHVEAGDLNGDGLPDLVVSVSGGMDRLEVYLSTGGGSFAAPLTALCLSDSAPTVFALGDLDRDGRLDAACIESGTDTVQVFRGNGTSLASAQAADRYAAGAGPVDVKLADVNGDGKLDLVVLCQTARTVEVRLGNGDGTFGGVTATGFSPSVGAASVIALGDIDRDGVLDLVVASADSTTIELFKGSGTGSFASQGTLGAGSGVTTATGIALADTNKDGHLDIVTSRGDTTGSVSFFKNTGGFAFASALTTPTAQGGLVVGVALGDLNGDGKLDVVAPCDLTKDVQVLIGR